MPCLYERMTQLYRHGGTHAPEWSDRIKSAQSCLAPLVRGAGPKGLRGSSHTVPLDDIGLSLSPADKPPASSLVRGSRSITDTLLDLVNRPKQSGGFRFTERRKAVGVDALST